MALLPNQGERFLESYFLYFFQTPILLFSVLNKSFPHIAGRPNEVSHMALTSSSWEQGAQLSGDDVDLTRH